jgi:hypothetical protein
VVVFVVVVFNSVVSACTQGTTFEHLDTRPPPTQTDASSFAPRFPPSLSQLCLEFGVCLTGA